LGSESCAQLPGGGVGRGTVGVGGRPSSGVVRAGGSVPRNLDLWHLVGVGRPLSAQTSIDRVARRVVEVLGAMTGATGVHLLLCSEDSNGCVVTTPAG